VTNEGCREEAVVKKQRFHILLVLAEAPRHGAEIQRRASEMTGGEVKLYPVTLYRTLDELAADGLIREVAAPADADHNERRRYFAITPSGRRALAGEAESLEAAARLARMALKPGRA
jgi:PadR family transcriptional regulator PadR